LLFSPHFKEALENAIDDIYDTHSIITGDNGGKSFIPGKLETSWIDELTDYADTFLEDEQTRQGNILNNKTKAAEETANSLILNGISPNSSENKLNKLVLSSRQFSPKVALKSSALSFSLFLLQKQDITIHRLTSKKPWKMQLMIFMIPIQL
jgi:hypothetical protein